MKDDPFTIGDMGIAFLLGLIIGGLIIGLMVEDTMQNAAITQGVGKWVINPTTGDKTFIHYRP